MYGIRNNRICSIVYYVFIDVISSIYAVYPYSLPTFTLKKECESVTQKDMSITCPPIHNAHAYLQNKQEFGNPNCVVTIICEHYNVYRADGHKTIQILP